jgi:hypothetical protein
MRSYREHLRVPASYWVLGFITMATFASFVWAGFSPLVAVASYLILVVAPGVALFAWGNATIMVADGELRASRAVLPLAQAGHVQVLDPQQTARLRGPLGDPAAVALVRPYLRRSVYIEVSGDAPASPYWLIGTRRPEELARAIEAARPQARAGDVPVAPPA